MEADARCRGLEAENKHLQRQMRSMQLTFISVRASFGQDPDAPSAAAAQEDAGLLCTEDLGSL